MSYKFLKENGTIYAISNNRIEELRESETYDQFGQTVGTDISGDSIELLTEKAVQVANELSEKLDLDYNLAFNDILNGFENSDIFDDLEAKLEKECEENRDYNLYYTTVNGFNYWDGSNWKTITVYAENHEPSHELIEDEKLEKELNDAIENMEWVKDGFGKKVYKYKDFIITETQFASDWSAYQIEEQ